jgi:hypothetical protein
VQQVESNLITPQVRMASMQPAIGLFAAVAMGAWV